MQIEAVERGAAVEEELVLTSHDVALIIVNIVYSVYVLQCFLAEFEQTEFVGGRPANL